MVDATQKSIEGLSDWVAAGTCHVPLLERAMQASNTVLASEPKESGPFFLFTGRRTEGNQDGFRAKFSCVASPCPTQIALACLLEEEELA